MMVPSRPIVPGMTTRIEHDPLGEKPVPADALYGIQTLRAAENFPISGLRPLPQFVDAVVWIKRSAALTHRETGRLEARLADAIVQAADEILGGQHRDQFIVDVYQAGAGTSHNMNVNEVLANRANELLGGERGKYAPVHPNDHVNMAQSTNDVIPDRDAPRHPRHAPAIPRRPRHAGRVAPAEGQGIRSRHQVGPHAPAGCHADPAGPGVHRLRCHGRAPSREAHPRRGMAARPEHRRHRGRHRASMRNRSTPS